MEKEKNLDVKVEIEDKTSRKLTMLYITALTAVALLSILGQLLIQKSINNQLSDSHVINLAGRQRYKSQQLAKLALLIHSNLDHKHYKDKIGELENVLKVWKKGHNGLQFGDPKMRLPGKNSLKIKRMFSSIGPYYNKIYDSAKEIILLQNNGINSNEEKEKFNKAIKEILGNEKLFLVGMDRIVHQYDIEAKEKVVFLRKAETLLLLFTLLILFIEGLFIFRPVVLTIRNTINELIFSERRASNLAQKLLYTNKNLEKSIKDLKDIYNALDNATILAKTDRYGIITYVNDKFCEISKFSKEELIGNRFDVISAHYHSKRFYDKMWETISGGCIWNDEIKNKAKDGSFFWLDATLVPVLNSDRTPDQYIGIYTDVTQRFKQSINEQKIRSSSLMEGQEKERKKIARELHDGLGQMLTALKFNIEGLKGAKSKREQTRLEEIKQFMLETIKETRRISFNLMPTVLNDFGIVSAFKHLSDQVSNHSGIHIIFENKSSVQRLNKTVEINLYRIVQEALNNAVKYAEANEVRIVLGSDEKNLQLIIMDNGVGFNKNPLESKKNLISSGNGISNIQERTSLINGNFKIETAPGKGTKIHIDIPFN